MIVLVLALVQTATSPQSGSDRATAPTAPSTVSDAALERLATRESRLPGRLYRLIYDDPSMRAEVRRVGFAKGCQAIADSRQEVSLRFVPMLVPATVTAIRKIVPEPQLSEMRFRSFVSGPLHIYARRIDDELDRTASASLNHAYSAMRAAFLKRTREFPVTENPADNIVMPKADIAAMLGMKGPYDLDKPSHLGMACAEALIPADERPTITTSPAPATLVVAPPQR